MSAHPCVVFNNNRSRFRPLASGATRHIVHRVSIGICNQHIAAYFYIVANSQAVVYPYPRTTHTYIIANNEFRARLKIHSATQVAGYGIYAFARREIEIITDFQFVTPPSCQCTLPGICTFRPSSAPYFLSTILLRAGQSFIKSADLKFRIFFIIKNDL